MLVEMLKEGNMERVEYAAVSGVPEAVRFSVWSVPDENARTRTTENFRIAGLNQGEGATADFAEVRERGGAASPYFVGHFPIKG